MMRDLEANISMMRRATKQAGNFTVPTPFADDSAGQVAMHWFLKICSHKEGVTNKNEQCEAKTMFLSRLGLYKLVHSICACQP